MQRTCPVRQRGSIAPVAVTAGVTLFFSSAVGVRVIDLSLSSVRWSTSPVTGKPRFPWKPLTPVTVCESYVPVILPEYQASWRIRTCRSRTASPVSPEW